MRHFLFSGSSRQVTRGLSMVVGSCLALLLAACGGSSMSGVGSTAGTASTATTASSENARLTRVRQRRFVSKPDAAGDFLNGASTTLQASLQLQTFSGAIGLKATSLPRRMQVDFPLSW